MKTMERKPKTMSEGWKNARNERMFTLLKAIHILATESQSAFKISELIKYHGFHTSVSKVLVDKGVIERVRNGKQSTYVWKSVRPHMAMAKAVMEACDKHVGSYRSNASKKTSVAEKPKRTVKILWGLFEFDLK